MSIAAEICKEKEIKFELKDEGNFVSAVFYRKIENKSSEKSSEKVSEKYRISIRLANNQRKNGEKPVENGWKKPITTDYDRLCPIVPDYEQLSIEEREILLYLLDNKKISRKYAVQLLKVGETKAKEIFKSLLNKGLIRRYGKGRSTYYVLASRGGN